VPLFQEINLQLTYDQRQGCFSLMAGAGVLSELRRGDPERVGQYPIVRRLSTSGLGQEYLATSPVGREIALRVIAPALADNRPVRERLAREIRVAAAVASPYTTRIVDADIGGPEPWIATEYVPGPTMELLIGGQGPVAQPRLLALAAALAEGLRDIHRAGLVHRGLRPSNVILGADRPRIANLGVAISEREALASIGTFLGAPEYLSPEQAALEEVAASSDVFSLGSLLVFAATGSGPFGAGDLRALLSRILNDDPDLTGVPSEISPLIASCLAKHPAERPPAAEVLSRVHAAAARDAGLDTTGLAALMATIASPHQAPAPGRPTGEPLFSPAVAPPATAAPADSGEVPTDDRTGRGKDGGRGRRLLLGRKRDQDIWPDDGVSDEDYWASVASDRPLPMEAPMSGPAPAAYQPPIRYGDGDRYGGADGYDSSGYNGYGYDSDGYGGDGEDQAWSGHGSAPGYDGYSAGVGNGSSSGYGVPANGAGFRSGADTGYGPTPLGYRPATANAAGSPYGADTGYGPNPSGYRPASANGAGSPYGADTGYSPNLSGYGASSRNGAGSRYGGAQGGQPVGGSGAAARMAPPSQPPSGSAVQPLGSDRPYGGVGQHGSGQYWPAAEQGGAQHHGDAADYDPRSYSQGRSYRAAGPGREHRRGLPYEGTGSYPAAPAYQEAPPEWGYPEAPARQEHEPTGYDAYDVERYSLPGRAEQLYADTPPRPTAPRSSGLTRGEDPGLPAFSRPGVRLPAFLAGPPVRAATAAAPPDHRVEGDPSSVRFLTGVMPERAPVGARISLLVRITLTAVNGASAGLKEFPVPPAGATVTITVSAPGLIPLGDLDQDLSVPFATDSDPVRFGFMVGMGGLHSIDVRAFAAGTCLGELTLQISVESGAALEQGRPRTAVMTGLAAEPGEVTLQVSRNAGGYSFQLLSEALYPVVLIDRLAGDPARVVEKIAAELRLMSQGRSPYVSAVHARNRLRSLGTELWADVVPEAIRSQFWAQRNRIELFTIASDMDTVPWELLYPVDLGNEDGFLVEQFPVVRRVYGQGRARSLRLNAGAAYVVPPRSPANALDEVTAVRSALPANVMDRGVQAALADVFELIEAIPSVLHFAGHTSYSDEAGSVISLDGGPLRPDDLAYAKQKRAFAGVSPLVFLNGCRTAGEVAGLTQMNGWAEKFMGAGAGAFIGSLWSVRSSSAKLFAEEFYRALVQDGHPLGIASLRARRAIAADEGDPTWLAYTVYGNPSASVQHDPTPA
jgi:serine/threonine protein kinase